MNSWKRTGMAMLALTLVGGAFVAISCSQKPPPSATRDLPEPQPARDSSPEESGAQSAAPPSEPADATGPEPRDSARADVSPETDASANAGDVENPRPQPKIPDFLRIVQRTHDDKRASVRARIEKPRRLVLETDNVTRVRIDRRELGLPRSRSITIRIDGQGIEWTPRYDVVELKRTIDGVWSPVKPIKPVGPGKP